MFEDCMKSGMRKERERDKRFEQIPIRENLVALCGTEKNTRRKYCSKDFVKIILSSYNVFYKARLY